MTTKIDLSTRLYNRPLMVDEQLADSIRHGIKNGQFEIDDCSASMDTMWSAVYAGERKPYEMRGSVAVIPVNGTLYHKVSWSGYSYTGYDFITDMLEYALNDSDVTAIALDINSGGGEVDGAFEASAKIKAATEKKPVMAMVNAHAYSAAYLLASAATKISVPKTGGVGSVGVVTAHVDYSKMLDNVGIDVTLLYKGKHKVDGNSYEPLPDDVKNRIESRLETTYNLFVDTVANNRSMNSQVIRDTEALTFGADEALSLGLVDSVSAPDEALTAFVAEHSGKQWGNFMTANATNQQATTQAESGNEASVVTAQDVANAKTEGASAERSRIMGILKCEESKGRESMAIVLCEQGLTVDAAKAVLAAAPVQGTSTQANSFAAAMNSTQNPELSADAGKDNAEVPAWKRALEAHSKATGIEYKLN